MVSIVIQDNSLVDLINAGLTVRHYKKKGEEIKVHFVNETKKEEFWNNIKKYVDERDRSLIILNFPLPEEEVLEKINLRPYEYSILYIPSEFISMTPQSKKMLLEKGIAFMPQRKSHKCFPGEYIDRVEKRWMKIGETISIESDLVAIKGSSIRILDGLLKIAKENPLLAIQKIEEDDVAFFAREAREPFPEISRRIEKPDCEVVFTKGRGSDLIRVAFDHFLSSRKTPIGVRGIDKSIILVNAPTFAHYIMDKCDIKAIEQIKLGKGAAFTLDTIDDANISLLIGRLAQRNMFIQFGKPRFVVQKTLQRRLVGGKGPSGRFYRGIKEKYPGIEIKKDIIATPRDAFEDVIDALKETGADFQILM